MTAESLDLTDDFLTIQTADGPIQLEIAEAYEVLSRIDRKRLGVESNHCLDCGAMFSHERARRIPSDDEGFEFLKCPECDSSRLDLDRTHLDDMAKTLKDRYGIKAGRGSAEKIYAAVVGLVERAKKKSGPTPESPIGSESIPPTGTVSASSPG